jgi:hypothetical protein
MCILPVRSAARHLTQCHSSTVISILDFIMQEFLLQPSRRSKLSIHVRGGGETARVTKPSSDSAASPELPSASAETPGASADVASTSELASNGETPGGASSTGQATNGASADGEERDGSFGNGICAINGGEDEQGSDNGGNELKATNGALEKGNRQQPSENGGPLVVKDIWEFKRGQMVFPSTR